MCSELLSDRKVGPTVTITFDDGYRDLYSCAFPVLQKYEIPATIYLIGQSMESGEAPWYDRLFVALDAAPGPVLDVQIGTMRRFVLSSLGDRTAAAWEIVCYLRSIADLERRKWCREFEKQIPVPQERLERRILDWEQVRAMQKSGISFGAHTMTHPAVSRLDEPALEEELGRSKQLLENGLGEAVEDFAYPFGKPSDCSLAAEKCFVKYGYRSAATTMEGFNLKGDNPHRLRRLQIGDARSMSSFAFTLGRMFLETSAAPQPAPARAVPYEGFGTQTETNESRL
jgi:peptidoglycan/xylan/chitin deacetylase (PgdA/CDA1 family)